MIKRSLYYILRAYVRVGLFFFFKKIEVHGKAGIPTDKGVIFLPNHQNAFLDALVLVTHNGLHTHFVARADVFTNSAAKWFLELINLMPIYRIRDGWQSLGRNQSIFEKCFKVLQKKEAVMMFPEGNHGARRRLRPLSKGFTRIAFGTQRLTPDEEIYIVPVGLNYTDHQRFRSSVSIYYGEPLLVKDYFKQDTPQEANRLKEAVAVRMKTLITHVEDEENYDAIITNLEKARPDYLKPREVNQLLKSPNSAAAEVSENKTSFINKLLFPVVVLNNLILLVSWKMVEQKIKDPVFVASLKFCFGLIMVPLVYTAQTLIVGIIFNGWWALGYLLVSVFTISLLAKN